MRSYKYDGLEAYWLIYGDEIKIGGVAMQACVDPLTLNKVRRLLPTASSSDGRRNRRWPSSQPSLAVVVTTVASAATRDYHVHTTPSALSSSQLRCPRRATVARDPR